MTRATPSLFRRRLLCQPDCGRFPTSAFGLRVGSVTFVIAFMVPVIATSATPVSAHADSLQAPLPLTTMQTQANEALPVIAGLAWGDPLELLVSGVPMRTTTFSTSRSAADVAAEFSHVFPAFGRIMTMPGQLIMSGLHDNRHWLAIIRSNMPETDGYLSVMDASRMATALPGILSEIPSSYSSVDVMSGSKVNHHVYRLSGAPKHWLTDLAHRLDTEGWHAGAGKGSADGPWHWERPGEYFVVVAVPDGADTAVFTLHIMDGARP